MARSAAAGAEARFRQLCSLGLGSEAVMRRFRRAPDPDPVLRQHLLLADAGGEMANVYDENPKGRASPRPIFQEFRGRDIEGSESFAGSMKRERGSPRATATLGST